MASERKVCPDVSLIADEPPQTRAAVTEAANFYTLLQTQTHSCRFISVEMFDY